MSEPDVNLLVEELLTILDDFEPTKLNNYYNSINVELPDGEDVEIRIEQWGFGCTGGANEHARRLSFHAARTAGKRTLSMKVTWDEVAWDIDAAKVRKKLQETRDNVNDYHATRKRRIQTLDDFRNSLAEFADLGEIAFVNPPRFSVNIGDCHLRLTKQEKNGYTLRDISLNGIIKNAQVKELKGLAVVLQSMKSMGELMEEEEES